MRLPARTPRALRAIVLVPAAAGVALGPAAWPAAAAGPTVAFTVKDPRITESSGLAASRLHQGVYWTHNDSGDGPYVYAVDSATGKTVAKVTMRGVGTVRDVEAISIGPDNRIYMGDIGDNLGGTWPKVWIYSFPEPARLRDTTVDATQYTVQYDGGPRDAEALMVQPKTGRVYIADKKEDGGGLFAGPEKLSTSGVNVFRRIADVPLWVTDGSFSPDGTRLVLRGYFSALEYRWSGGAPHRIGNLEVPLQRQGESVTFTPDGRALMYGSEGAGSQVWREPLSGDELPDSAARASASAQPSSGGGGTDDAGGGGASSHSTAPRDAGLGALTLAVVTVLVMAGRRALRRRS